MSEGTCAPFGLACVADTSMCQIVTHLCIQMKHPSIADHVQVQSLRTSLLQASIVQADVHTVAEIAKKKAVTALRRLPKDQPGIKASMMDIRDSDTDNFIVMMEEILPYYNDIVSQVNMLRLDEQQRQHQRGAPPPKPKRVRKLFRKWEMEVRDMVVSLDQAVNACQAAQASKIADVKASWTKKACLAYDQAINTTRLSKDLPMADLHNFPMHNLDSSDQVVAIYPEGTKKNPAPHWECLVCKKAGLKFSFSSNTVECIKRHILRQEHTQSIRVKGTKTTAAVDLKEASEAVVKRDAISLQIRRMTSVTFAQQSQSASSAALASLCIAKALRTVGNPVPEAVIRLARREPGLEALATLGERFNACVVPTSVNANGLSAPTSIHRTGVGRHVSTAAEDVKKQAKLFFKSALYVLPLLRSNL